MINFDENYTNSIKSTVTEHNSTVKLTTHFMKGKMLMFSKTLRISFVYDIIDVYCFPDENVKKIYEKYNIQKCFLYQNLTNTDSTLLFFILICNMNSPLSKKSRNIIFEV